MHRIPENKSRMCSKVSWHKPQGSSTKISSDTDDPIHSCRAKWSPKTLSQTIWTVKDVQPGEELSISCKGTRCRL